MPKTGEQASDVYKFSGFVTPRFTQIPDQLFDELLPILSGNEIKTLLYICRRTFGFKKDGDNISLAQMVAGITTIDGVKLDGGTGLSKASVARALKALEEKRIILRVRRRNEKRGDLPTAYRLNIQESSSHLARPEQGSHNSETPRVSHRDTPLSHHETPRVSHRDTQQTVEQETAAAAKEPLDALAQRRTNLVAALMDFEMSKENSQRLVTEYPLDYVAEKIDFLTYKLAQQPGSVKRPAAWLWKAIKDDYSAPKGYVPAAERERQANAQKERKRTASDAQKAVSAHTEQLDSARVAQQNKQLEKFFKRYRTSKADQDFWQKAQKHLAKNGISATSISSLQLLKLSQDEVVCHVPNGFMHQRILQPKIKKMIETALGQLAERPIRLTLVLDEE